MTSSLLVAHSYLALSALAPATAAASAPLHGTRGPAPVRHVARPAPLVSLTPSSVRLKAQRADGRVSLTLV